MGSKRSSSGSSGVAPGDAAKSFLSGKVSKICPCCEDTFSCGASTATCWCQDLPVLDLAALADRANRAERADLRFASADKSCLCSACLTAALALVAKP